MASESGVTPMSRYPEAWGQLPCAWLKVPKDFVLRPHLLHPKLQPRHVWLIMRLLAQPRSDLLGDYRVRATWSQLRNASDRDDPSNVGKKLRKKKGDPSYDTIRKWGGELKRMGLLTWRSGGRSGDQERASTFDYSALVRKLEQLEPRRRKGSR
jgi:hypothetical protein